MHSSARAETYLHAGLCTTPHVRVWAGTSAQRPFPSFRVGAVVVRKRMRARRSTVGAMNGSTVRTVRSRTGERCKQGNTRCDRLLPPVGGKRDDTTTFTPAAWAAFRRALHHCVRWRGEENGGDEVERCAPTLPSFPALRMASAINDPQDTESIQVSGASTPEGPQDAQDAGPHRPFAPCRTQKPRKRTRPEETAQGKAHTQALGSMMDETGRAVAHHRHPMTALVTTSESL